jgi:hypothetical protein
MLGRLILVIKQLLDTLAQVVDQVAASRKQVADLLQENAAPTARLDQAQRRASRQATPFSKVQRLARPQRHDRSHSVSVLGTAHLHRLGTPKANPHAHPARARGSWV